MDFYEGILQYYDTVAGIAEYSESLRHSVLMVDVEIIRQRRMLKINNCNINKNIIKIRTITTKYQEKSKKKLDPWLVTKELRFGKHALLIDSKEFFFTNHCCPSAIDSTQT